MFAKGSDAHPVTAYIQRKESENSMNFQIGGESRKRWDKVSTRYCSVLPAQGGIIEVRGIKR